MAVMSDRTSLSLDGGPPGGPPEAPGGAPEWIRLEFIIQGQEQTQWCWSAVAVSVAEFYEPGGWTQCQMVCDELEQSSCCEDGSTEECNQPWYLDQALERAGVFNGMEGVPPAGIAPIPSEISSGHLFCARIEWSGGGGHFVVIDGYTEDETRLAIEDPWYGASDLTAETFRGAYQGNGSWTHSYLTSP
ncbi:MAG TPA: papain-like cysteine protease family protein [Solirubrobacterales bacterium]|nr:papain-like cysteine protease family protein [Solirubrobacterales bacterium]